MARTEAPLYFDITLGENNIDEEKWKILSILRPEWTEETVSCKNLSGGFVNLILGITLKSDTNKKDGIVIRVWKDVQASTVNRDREVASMMAAYVAGCGSRVYAVFTNGVAIGYIPGKPLTWDDIADPHIARKLGRAFAKFHYVDTDHPLITDRKGKKFNFTKNPNFFKALKQSLENKPSYLKDPDRNARYQEDIMSYTELKQEIAFIESHVDLEKYDVILSHNDLWTSNVMYDDQKGEVYLLDFEFSDTGYNIMDISLFQTCLPLLQHIGQEKDSTEHEDDVKKVLLRAYLECRAETKGDAPNDFTDDDVTQMLKASNMWGPINALYWLIIPLADLDNLDKTDLIEFGKLMQKMYYDDRHLIEESG